MFNEAPKQITYPKNPGEVVSWDHYFQIMNEIWGNIGEDSPLAQMAGELCQEFGIARGPTSALTRTGFDLKNEQQPYARAKENDRIIGTVFANIPGVYVGMGENKLTETSPIVTMDINKILDALEKGQGDLEIQFQEFISALPEKDANIIMTERGLRKKKREQSSSNRPLTYFRSFGGVGVFLRGYRHNKEWQKDHETDFVDMYADNSSIVLTEGYPDKSVGDSIKKHLQSSDYQGYDILIRGIISRNSNILLGEIDGRDSSKVKMDQYHNFLYSGFVDLPSEFYENYYAYLSQINPKLREKIAKPQNLKEILRLQSTSPQGLLKRDFRITDEDTNTKFHSHPSVGLKSQSLPHMNGFELGQAMYADALSAVKLHLLARLSSDGYLPAGPIVDFQGSDHISAKTFFMQYPQYALMVVLMNIQELMAGQAKKLSSNEETAVQYSREIFSNPDWGAVIREIFKLPIFSVKSDSAKNVEPSHNQKELLDKSPDFEKIYGIDIPRIKERLKNTFEQSTKA
ncbi:MAG: hypothetical protein M3M85_01295 [bacterium]|nr:hypothetical protein [bacterium]